MRALPRAVAVFGFAVAATAHAAEPKFEVQLKRSWIEAFKDRTSIEAAMVIHHSHKKPNKVGAGSQDGDLHFSGESQDVGLPFVAEIVNAASEPSAVAMIKNIATANEKASGAGRAVPVAGAWRLWFEHPSRSQIQGADNPFTPDSTNPNHSFEIHPVSAIGPVGSQRFDVIDSFAPVQDPTTNEVFEAYSAETAFPYFESLTCRIKASGSGVAIRSTQLKYNYVEFTFELMKPPKAVSDGFIALGRIVGDNPEKQLPSGVRMIFVKDSAPATTISRADVGETLHVLGIPRVNLNAVSFLVEQNGTREFSARLPYEMIIVGVYAD
jgi:hypothetical protein